MELGVEKVEDVKPINDSFEILYFKDNTFETLGIVN